MDINGVTEIARPRNRIELPNWKPGDAWLAGGTWLYSEPQPSVSRLVDIVDLDWPALQIDDAGLRIAATCTIAALDGMAFPPQWTVAPLVNQCCRSFLSSFKIWNTATVGGNLCMALPAGPMISLTAALDGTCVVWQPDGGERTLPVSNFVIAPQRNALRPGELLREIILPLPALRQRAAFRQVSLSPLGRSAVLCIGTTAPDGALALTVTASTPRPVRLFFSAAPDPVVLRDAIEAAIPAGHYYDDAHGAPAWRRHMTLQFAEEIRAELAGSTKA
jgi:CO/xanthine dehydrogenase FAD-binding subunit